MTNSLIGCLFFPALFFCALGLALGVVSLVVIRKSGGRLLGVGRARTSILVSLCSLGIMTFFLTTFREARFLRKGPRASESTTMFGAFSKMVGSGAPYEWFDGQSSETKASGMRSGEAVEADDAKAMQEWVKKVGFRDTAARHLATLTLRHDRMKGTDVQIVTWFAEVETGIDPARVMAMKRTMPGEISIASGRLLMGVFSHQHPEGEELVQRLARYYSDEIARIERERGSD